MKRQYRVCIFLSSCVLFTYGCHLEPPTDCLLGQSKCETDSVMLNAITSVCGIDHQWYQYTCLDTCNEDKTDCNTIDNIPVCTVEGEQQCVASESFNVSLTCVNEKWIATLCDVNSSCHENQCEASDGCTEGMQDCIDVDTLNASIAVTCHNNHWNTQYCPKNVKCAGDSCGTLSEDVTHCGFPVVDCTSSITGWGNGRCDGGQCEVMECISGYHVYDGLCEENDDSHCGTHDNNCVSGDSIANSKYVYCDPEAGRCEVVECDSGYHVYENACEENDDNHCGTHYSSCISGDSIANSKTMACDSEIGRCVATVCKSGYHVYEGLCEKNDNDHCGTHDEKCTIDMFEGSESVSCESGTCMITACGNNYIQMENVCLESDCEDNEEKCVNENNIGSMYKCMNKSWEKQNACQDNASCMSNTECGECQNTDTKCDNKSDIGSVSTCSDGKWGEAVSCNTTSCSGKICGECKNNAVKCTDDAVTNIGVKYTCASGSWGTGTDCNNKSCNGTACGSCLNGDSRCYEINSTSSDTIETCSNGQYGTPKKCTTDVSNALFGACMDDSVCGGFKCNMAHIKTIDKSNGSCMATECDDDYLLCDGGCFDKYNDNNHCGSCGNVCTGAKVCINGSCVESPTCGDGSNYMSKTVIDPTTSSSRTVNAFCINSVAMFNRVKEAINEGKAYPSGNSDKAYILTTDLTLDPLTYTPIGNSDHPFTGFFLGNDKAIYLNDAEMTVISKYYGLFGVVKKAYIHGINLYINLFNESYSYIGGLAGKIETTLIENTIVHPTIQNKGTRIENYETNYIGGMVGDVSGESKISNSSVLDASIDATGCSSIGGLAGSVKENAGIDTCLFNGTINGDGWDLGALVGLSYGSINNSHALGSMTLKSGMRVGGFVGHLFEGTITNSYSKVSINYDIYSDGSSTFVGGFVGYSTDTKIEDCYATGDVTGSSCVGGFIGSGRGKFTNCYASGDVKGRQTRVGGFIGEVYDSEVNDSISFKQCGSFGKVTDKTGSSHDYYTGGFVGKSEDVVTVENCYALNNISVPIDNYGNSINIGGFAGYLAKGGTLKNNYTLTSLTPNTRWGDFVGTLMQSITMSNNYYHSNASASVIGSGASYVDLSKIKPVTITQSGDTYTVYTSDGTTKLGDALGSSVWTTKTCTIDIGEGKKKYVVPISTTIYPDFCEQ